MRRLHCQLQNLNRWKHPIKKKQAMWISEISKLSKFIKNLIKSWACLYKDKNPVALQEEKRGRKNTNACPWLVQKFLSKYSGYSYRFMSLSLLWAVIQIALLFQDTARTLRRRRSEKKTLHSVFTMLKSRTQ